MIGNIFMGWWSVSGAITTPFIVLQNAIDLLTRPRVSTLRYLLGHAGIDLDDVVIDASGLTREQRFHVEALLGVLCEMVWADGHADPRELEIASDIASRVIGASVTTEEIELRIRARYRRPVALETLSPEMKLLLFRAAVGVACADGVLADTEKRYLQQLARRLQLPPELVERHLRGMGFKQRPNNQPHPDLVRSAQVLGVDVDASPAEAKRAYRRQAMRHHPDRVNDSQSSSAHQRMSEINWAYNTFSARGKL
jgi:uncharacterized tellurite resistance protein B-like protein